jgi:spermidine/putrescine transport system substrate-binding protein
MKRHSNKRRIALLTIAALASASIFQIQAQQNVLNLFNWSEYMDPAILKDFEKKFNVKVNVSLFESNEDLIAKLETSGKGQYDVVIPGQYIVPILAKKGLLEKLDKAQIPNLKNLSKKFLSPSYDPGNTYSAAYQWGTVGIVYRKDKLKNFDPSWGLLFDKGKQQGPFIMMDSTREMLGPALMYLGKSLNTTNKPDLKKALEIMTDAKNRSLGFDGGVGGKNKVVASQANYAVAYNGDAIKAAEEDKNVGYLLPKEGSVIFVDSMAIPAGAKNSKMAHAFINFILEPKVGARLSNFNRYATPNEAAKAFVDPKDAKNPAIYPAAAVTAKLEFILDLAADNKLYDSIWTKIKAQ